ncbi:hypothetical protein A2662_04525 [Candidatus Giovannonibacteria bacterium RIFCSPHIGHO2_01_FULL_45_33]|nr:MAG: hypothetical protein A2662_04525 [Candidatus Giovannonibacteria bacterium RIFCSPHIGHO2_01_FULL_45_33]
MVTVTIPKKEYKELVEKKMRYEQLRQIIEGDLFTSPSTHSTKEVLTGFRATKKYSVKFLKSLEKGLKRSSYFKA